MHKCPNRRCKRLVTDRGYCRDCKKSRRETLAKARSAYLPQFLARGEKAPVFSLPSSM